MNRLFVLLLLLVIATQQAKGQQLQITNYSSKDGVPVYGANSIFQDSKGWMWFTTGYEVMKYDGHRFRIFPPAANTTMNFCFKVIEIGREIWIIATPHVLKVSGDSLTRVKNISDRFEVSDHIQHLDQHYFLGRNGLYKMEGHDLRSLIVSDELPINPPQTLVSYNDSLIISLQPGLRLIVFDLKQKAVLSSSLAVTDIRQDLKKNTFLLVKGTGIMTLKKIETGKRQVRTMTETILSFDNSKYTRFVPDEKGSFWTFDQFKELVKLNSSDDKKTYRESSGLPSLWFNEMFVDREKNLWIGFNGGLSKIGNTNWERYTAAESLYSNHILFFAGGFTSRQVFVGTQNGVNIIENKQVRQVRHKGQPFICERLVASSSSLYYARDNILYEGTIDPGGTEIVTEKKLAQLPALSIQFIKDKRNNLIIATPRGIYAYSNNQLMRLTNDTNYFRSILLDREDRLWAGRFAGALTCYRLLQDNKRLWLEELFSLDSIAPGMPRVSAIRAMAETKDGDILVGTRNNGLFVLPMQNNKMMGAIHYGKENGLGSNTVWDIGIDAEGSCWIAMTHGLTRLNKINKQWKLYSEGIKRQLYQATLLFADAENNIWVGSHPGLVITRKDTGGTETPFSVAVTGIMVNDKHVASDQAETSRLKHSENNVSIEFSANAYSQEESVLYSFRLHDKDDWTVPAATHQVNYSALRPGNYRFSVKAINVEGQWSSNEAGFNFSIIAPFWQQSWFIALVIAVVAAAVYALYRYRLKRIKELFEMRNVIASDLHDEIGSTLTSINILSKVSHSNLDKDRQKASSLLKKVITQSQEIQENMSDIVWSIRPDNDKMENIILRMHEYLSHTLEPENIQVSFTVDDKIVKESLTMQQRRDFFLVFKEAINNIAKYAMCSMVDIHLAHRDGQICLFIHDNGIGFDPDAKKASNGLRNMQHRAALLNGKISIRSVMGNGTSVELEMPATS